MYHLPVVDKFCLGSRPRDLNLYPTDNVGLFTPGRESAIKSGTMKIRQD